MPSSTSRATAPGARSPGSCASTWCLSKLRLFFALWPPRETAAALHAWAVAVQRASGGRVTRAETIHLTLAFLGDVAEERLSVLQALQLKGEKHSLPIEQGRYWKHNRIVWVGPRETPAPLADLASALKLLLEKNEFRAEERKFAAHITLVRKVHDPKPLPHMPAVSWPVGEYVLVRSHLSSKGPSYEVLQRYPLS